MQQGWLLCQLALKMKRNKRRKRKNANITQCIAAIEQVSHGQNSDDTKLKKYVQFSTMKKKNISTLWICPTRPWTSRSLTCSTDLLFAYTCSDQAQETSDVIASIFIFLTVIWHPQKSLQKICRFARGTLKKALNGIDASLTAWLKTKLFIMLLL